MPSGPSSGLVKSLLTLANSIQQLGLCRDLSQQESLAAETLRLFVSELLDDVPSWELDRSQALWDLAFLGQLVNTRDDKWGQKLDEKADLLRGQVCSHSVGFLYVDRKLIAKFSSRVKTTYQNGANWNASLPITLQERNYFSPRYYLTLPQFSCQRRVRINSRRCFRTVLLQWTKNSSLLLIRLNLLRDLGCCWLGVAVRVRYCFLIYVSGDWRDLQHESDQTDRPSGTWVANISVERSTSLTTVYCHDESVSNHLYII